MVLGDWGKVELISIFLTRYEQIQTTGVLLHCIRCVLNLNAAPAKYMYK